MDPMASFVRLELDVGLGQCVEVRRVGMDDLSHVRYVHTTSFRSLGAAHYSEEELDAFGHHIAAPAYADKILGDEALAAWLGAEMVATVAWSAADTGLSARICSLFVRPLFTRVGIGRRLVCLAEDEARSKGFQSFRAVATMNAVSFFERQGYRVTSYGTRAIAPQLGLAVAFMRKDDTGAPTSRVAEVQPA